MSTTSIPKKQPAQALTQKELILLRKTSTLSDKEIQQWHKTFLETYPTGKIDKNTFAEIFKSFSANAPADVIEQSFKTADQNGDGTIDFNEFLFCTAIGARESSLDDRLDVIFDLWDTSNDEQLDVNELASLISAMYDRTRVADRQGDKNPTDRAKEIIKKLDISGDKKLSREEFIKGLKGDPVIAGFLAPK